MEWLHRDAVRASLREAAAFRAAQAEKDDYRAWRREMQEGA